MASRAKRKRRKKALRDKRRHEQDIRNEDGPSGYEADPKDVGTYRERLFKSINASYRHLSQYRTNVRKLNEAYAGPMYGMEGQNDYQRPIKYINLLKQAVSTYVMMLGTNRPQVLITTTKMELKPFAGHFQVAVNRLLEEIDLDSILNQWVRDAFMWMGIIRVHMADTGRMVHEEDVTMDPGMPFASNISLDNFFFDTNAKKWTECKYMGDVYRLPVEVIRDSGIYDGPALDDLTETSKYGGLEESTKDIAFGYEVEDDEFEAMADLADVWTPRDQKIRTYLVKSRSGSGLVLHGPAIAEIDWSGMELGPYKKLSFDEVSENVLPLSTAADLYPLDRLANSLYRKNARKAQRAKENPAFTPAGQDTAQRVKTSSDGEWVQTTNPSEINVIKSGGVDPAIQGFMANTIEMFDRMSGNLPALLGLGASSDTVGQERIINAGASGRMGQLQDMVRAPTTSLVRDLAFLLWKDDFTELPARVEVEGLKGISYDATWYPEEREGQFKDYQLEIDVYSMAYSGPGQRIQAINQLLSEIYIPMLPILQQQGGSIDLARLVELQADMYNLPRFKEIVVFNSPPVSPDAEGTRKPPTSNRTYTRRNVSAGDESGSPDASEWISATSES